MNRPSNKVYSLTNNYLVNGSTTLMNTPFMRLSSSPINSSCPKYHSNLNLENYISLHIFKIHFINEYFCNWKDAPRYRKTFKLVLNHFSLKVKTHFSFKNANDVQQNLKRKRRQACRKIKLWSFFNRSGILLQIRV